MRMRDVLKLHNGDEVIRKSNGEAINVLYIRRPLGAGWANTKYKELEIIGVGSEGQYVEISHKEVK